MSDAARRYRAAAVANVLEGAGKASREERRAAFDNRGVSAAGQALIDKVARHAYRVTDEDIAAAKTAGLTEDQIFELCVCAAMGQATRQYDAAIAALDAFDAEEKR